MSVNINSSDDDSNIEGIFETPKNQRFRQMRQKMVVDRV